MSRTRKAALTSGFLYAQYTLALVSGLVIFPVVVFALGAYDYGLWLASGELVGYLLLGDLGVFAVLPWLVAGRDGAGDRAAIPSLLSDGLAVGVVAGGLILAAAAAVWFLNPAVLPISPAAWEKVREPVALLLGLTGLTFPFKAFLALLGGLQDVSFAGLVNVSQQALTVGLTAVLVLSGYGMLGLAIAAGLPPLLGGLAGAGTCVDEPSRDGHDTTAPVGRMPLPAQPGAGPVGRWVWSATLERQPRTDFRRRRPAGLGHDLRGHRQGGPGRPADVLGGSR